MISLIHFASSIVRRGSPPIPLVQGALLRKQSGQGVTPTGRPYPGAKVEKAWRNAEPKLTVGYTVVPLRFVRRFHLKLVRNFLIQIERLGPHLEHGWHSRCCITDGHAQCYAQRRLKYLHKCEANYHHRTRHMQVGFTLFLIGHEGPQGEQRYSSTLSRTSVHQIGKGGSASRPGRLYPGKDPVPILQEAGWAPGPVWTGGISHPHRDSIPDPPARSQSLY